MPDDDTNTRTCPWFTFWSSVRWQGKTVRFLRREACGTGSPTTFTSRGRRRHADVALFACPGPRRRSRALLQQLVRVQPANALEHGAVSAESPRRENRPPMQPQQGSRNPSSTPWARAVLGEMRPRKCPDMRDGRNFRDGEAPARYCVQLTCLLRGPTSVPAACCLVISLANSQALDCSRLAKRRGRLRPR